MINEVTDNLKIPQPPTRIERSKFCTHSNFGGIFETDSITCDVDIELQYSGTQVVGSSQALEQIKTFLINRGITTKLNSNNESSQNLGLYDFEYQNLGCFSQASYNRNADGSTANQSFSIEMDCGGKAKVDYFPVVKD
jgi:hypothetical protein